MTSVRSESATDALRSPSGRSDLHVDPLRQGGLQLWKERLDPVGH